MSDWKLEAGGLAIRMSSAEKHLRNVIGNECVSPRLPPLYFAMRFVKPLVRNLPRR